MEWLMLHVQLPLKHANTRYNNVHFSRSLSDMLYYCYSLYLLAGLQPTTNIHCDCEQQADIVLLMLYLNKLLTDPLLSCFFLTIQSWVIVHFCLVLWRPWPLTTISVTQTHCTEAGQPVALLPYCLSSLQSWPHTQRCRSPFLFIMVCMCVCFWGGSSICIVSVCHYFLFSFTDLFSTSCLCDGPV